MYMTSMRSSDTAYITPTSLNVVLECVWEYIYINKTWAKEKDCQPPYT